ncbi:MAG: hypothetical protein JW783_16190 [Bacteroidales bacterium]|nr:hypothetical protein [Bacteroidales bacterium]MBN2750679.1 hypothetical protein [Bacteroidales bacterium]
MRKVLLLSTAILIILGSNLALAQNDPISASLTIQKAHKGKLVNVKANVYYSIAERRMVACYTYPSNFYMLVNETGEVRAYYPETNQVILNQNDFFSANTDVFYFFISQGTSSDVGLKSVGFDLISSRFEGNLTITRWKAPVNLQPQIVEAELVLENYVPIYLAYYNDKNEVSNKTFYSNYKTIGGVVVPTRVTEFAYVAKNDSIISRKDYTNIVMGNQVNRSFLDFKIPTNAKVVKK